MLFLNNAEFSAIMVIQKGVSGMPDYKEMYLHLMRETESAIRILVKAQQDCEELHQASPPPPGGGRGPGGKGAKLPQDVALQSERPHYI